MEVIQRSHSKEPMLLFSLEVSQEKMDKKEKKCYKLMEKFSKLKVSL